jgi:hypothetical protein
MDVRELESWVSSNLGREPRLYLLGFSPTSAMNISLSTRARSEPCILIDSFRTLKGGFARSYIASAPLGVAGDHLDAFEV